MTNIDLRIGMIVETRNKSKFLVTKHCLAVISYTNEPDIYACKYFELKNYNDDLTRIPVYNDIQQIERAHKFDIVKVYQTENLQLALQQNFSELNLIWKREENDSDTYKVILQKIENLERLVHRLQDK